MTAIIVEPRQMRERILGLYAGTHLVYPSPWRSEGSRDHDLAGHPVIDCWSASFQPSTEGILNPYSPRHHTT